MTLAQPWVVIPSPTDRELWAVHGVYLVADALPIEDARLIAAAPELLAFATAYRLDLKDLGVSESDMDECAMALLDMADTAIAKATGAA